MGKDIDIVIGGLYGDEGKGRTVDYLTRHYQDSSLVILTNGSAQRGHTVVNNNRRHVFRHFGSGTYNGAKSFAPDTFVLNPVVFHKEYSELIGDGITPTLYVDWNCPIATPWDSLINQCCEMAKENDRYGSCGQGVYESMYRTSFGPSIKFFNLLYAYRDGNGDIENLKSLLYEIQNVWMPNRISELIGFSNIPDMMRPILALDYVPHFLLDLKFMIEHVSYQGGYSSNSYNGNFSRMFSHIVCENGQGLAISQKYHSTENVTPSYTGLGAALNILKSHDFISKDDTITVNYIYKWFTTRHGYGLLDRETSRENLSANIYDRTNIPNEWQGSLRFAPLNINKAKRYLSTDALSITQWNEIGERIKFNVVVNGVDMVSDNGLMTIVDEYNIQRMVKPNVLYSKMLQMVSNEQQKYNKLGGCRILVGYGQDAKDSSVYSQGDLE